MTQTNGGTVLQTARTRHSAFGMYLYASVLMAVGGAVTISTGRWVAFWIAFGVSTTAALLALAVDTSKT